MKQTWGVSYSESGMTQLLKRMSYVYKKPKLVPGKAKGVEESWPISNNNSGPGFLGYGLDKTKDESQ